MNILIAIISGITLGIIITMALKRRKRDVEDDVVKQIILHKAIYTNYDNYKNNLN
tara:strand:- start:3072 stop:3236 length:165 start_codon:yes stop_codon:yes gene_type:complete